MTDLKVRNVTAAHHRNGIGGAGHYVIAFEARDGEDIPDWEQFVGMAFGSVYPDELGEDDHAACMGVVRLRELVEAYPHMDKLAAWRSADYFWPLLRPLIHQALYAEGVTAH